MSNDGQLSDRTLYYMALKERDALAEALAFYVQQSMLLSDPSKREEALEKMQQKWYQTRELMRSVVPQLCEKWEGM